MRNCGVEGCNMPCWGTDKLTLIPYCKSHQYLRTDTDKRSSLQKHMDKQKALGNVVSEEDKVDKAEMDLFWLTAEQELSKDPHCRECGAFIPKEYYRAATAHILMKSIFESVKSHPDNRLFLGAGCGCHDKTHRLDTFAKMKVFPIAVMKFRLFEKFVTEKHKQLDLFREYAAKNDEIESGCQSIEQKLNGQT